MTEEDEILDCCLKVCGIKTTREYVLNSLDCNFCDIPYILIELERKED